MKNTFLGIKHFFLYSLIFFIIFLTIAFSVLYVVEKRVRTAKFDEVKTHENLTIDLELELLGHEFGMIISDLNYLSRAYKYDLDDKAQKGKLIKNWIEFSYQHGIYDQIRFIDSAGDEQIRINLGNTSSYLTPPNQLNNKIDKYYFTETSKLLEGSIYISQLDLNMENGIVEVPYKPMIRFCTPIYNDEQEFLGIVVLNYLAENLLISFKEIATNSYGEMDLLNSNGDWLSSSQVSREWNFMFEGRETLTFSWFFDEWEYIMQGQGQKVTEAGLFTYNSVDLSSKIKSSIVNPDKQIQRGDGNWYIVSYILRNKTDESVFPDEFLPLARDVFRHNLILFILSFLISLVIGYLFYLYVKAYKKTKKYSKYDSLTKIFNRRAGTQKLEALLAQNERRKFEMSLCFIDVNGLKYVNDILGHKMGDELIVTVATIIKNSIRDNDFVARMGGDEFIILFSGIDAELAQIVWSRIYMMFEKVNREEDRPYVISVSHGIAGYDSSMGAITSEELIKSADSLMYEQKRRMKAGLTVIRGQEEE